MRIIKNIDITNILKNITKAIENNTNDRKNFIEKGE
jgi:hypothetical protein